MIRRRTLSILITTAALSACTGHGWKQLQEEFPEIRTNCGLKGTVLERDAGDKRLLRLGFLQRHNAALQASRDGSLACIEHWARERGYRVVTGGI